MVQKGVEIMSSIYRMPSAHFRPRCVTTNTAPTRPCRSAGRPAVMFVMERLIDLAAREHGFDRLELRRRNLLSETELPLIALAGEAGLAQLFVGRGGEPRASRRPPPSSMAGIELTHIPYKSATHAVIDLVEGRIDLQFGSCRPPAADPHRQAARAGVDDGQTARRAAEVPTFDESGLKVSRRAFGWP